MTLARLVFEHTSCFCVFLSHQVFQRAAMLGGRGRVCLSQSSRESGSVTPLVSGSSRHRPQPTIGALLYTTMAAGVIAPLGLRGTRVLARHPSRKLRLTRDTQRCLDYKGLVILYIQPSKCEGVFVYLTTVGNSSMAYSVEMKVAARMQSFPSRARLITSTGSPGRTTSITYYCQD